MKANALQLRQEILKDIAKIRLSLGKDPNEFSKSLAVLIEDLRRSIAKKHWVKSIHTIMLINRLDKSIKDFNDIVEDLHRNTILLQAYQIYEIVKVNMKISIKIQRP